MNLSLILGAVWVLAATATALLPMRHQYVPGLTLLILAPVLIGFLGYEHGLWVAALAFLAFLPDDMTRPRVESELKGFRRDRGAPPPYTKSALEARLKTVRQTRVASVDGSIANGDNDVVIGNIVFH